MRFQRRILISENCGSFLTDDKFENFDEFVLDHKTENSEEVPMAGKIENSEKIVIDAQNGAKLDEVKNSQSYARDLTEFENLVEWTRVRTQSPELGWRHRQWQHQQGQQNQERVAATNTSLKRRVFWSMPMMRLIKQRHQYVLDDTDRGKWIKEEAVVDSGTVECVTSRERVPHLKVEDTPESRRVETWTFA